jgi:hypothetical protein
MLLDLPATRSVKMIARHLDAVTPSEDADVRLPTNLGKPVLDVAEAEKFLAKLRNFPRPLLRSAESMELKLP